MKINEIPNATRNLTRPENWDDATMGTCVSLPIVDMEQDGVPVMVSSWQPTDDELARLNNGAPVYLHVVGEQHPPVMLSVSEDEEFVDEPDTLVDGLDRYNYDTAPLQEWVDITTIVVPTARDKVQLLLAFKYIHDLRCIDTDYLAVNTLIHQYEHPGDIKVEAPVCDIPPTGWLCTREVGHSGPCAAWPL